MKQAASLLLVVLFVFIVATVVVLFFQNRQKNPYVINMSSQTVIKQMRSLNRLETATYTIEKVIDVGTNGNAFQQVLFGDKILLIAHGDVIAGFDLSQMSDTSVSEKGQTVRLTLPAPQILVSRLDNDQTRVYDRQEGLLSKGDKNLESQARSAAEKAIRDAACQGKILDDAAKNARNQLTALMKSLGFTTVIITIPAGTC